jgi:WhiB family transcriptional regulator, redox-sensing transcriptional regulator
MTSALAMAEREFRRSWRYLAICRTEDPELFYPVSSSGHVYAAQVERAKAVCRRCPVRAECLSEALTNPLGGFGIWGGLAEDERRDLRRGR